MKNNFVKPKTDEKSSAREKRKPVSQNFVPKRLAVSVEPPMIILQYMVPDSGKLYHHKMRLQSKMHETFDTKQLLQYLKKKHSSYFTNGNPKIKDAQILQLIEKIVSQYEQQDEQEVQKQSDKASKQPTTKNAKSSNPPVVKDFDFLDDEQDAEENQYGKQQWDLEMGQDADIV